MHALIAGYRQLGHALELIYQPKEVVYFQQQHTSDCYECGYYTQMTGPTQKRSPKHSMAYHPPTPSA